MILTFCPSTISLSLHVVLVLAFRVHSEIGQTVCSEQGPQFSHKFKESFGTYTAGIKTGKGSIAVRYSLQLAPCVYVAELIF